MVTTSPLVRVILAQGHANLLCIVPILTGHPRKGIQDTFVHVPNMSSAFGTRGF